mgnify:CR=1 FL=1
MDLLEIPVKDSARFYDVPGIGRIPSVTTILQVISKPALMNWAAKQGTHKAKIIMDKLLRMAPALHDSMLGELGPEFFKDGNAQATEAADYGTQAHGIIEGILKKTKEDWFSLDLPSPVVQAVNSFLVWRDKTDLKMMKAESMVYSKKLGFAGTADAIAEVDGVVTLLDWKTSKGIYPEYKLQTVAYKYAAEEMSGESIPRVMICRFGKDGSFEDYEVPPADHPSLFDSFIDAKRLWEWQRREYVIGAVA